MLEASHLFVEFGGLGTGGTSHDFSTESLWESHLDTVDASEIWLTTWDVENLGNNGINMINYQPPLVSLPDFW